jgi:hypothetical protein
MAEKNDERNTHGGGDKETISQKVTTQQTSTIRKEVIKSRPTITTTEHVVDILFPKL